MGYHGTMPLGWYAGVGLELAFTVGRGGLASATVFVSHVRIPGRFDNADERNPSGDPRPPARSGAGSPARRLDKPFAASPAGHGGWRAGFGARFALARQDCGPEGGTTTGATRPRRTGVHYDDPARASLSAL